MRDSFVPEASSTPMAVDLEIMSAQTFAPFTCMKSGFEDELSFSVVCILSTFEMKTVFKINGFCLGHKFEDFC